MKIISEKTNDGTHCSYFSMIISHEVLLNLSPNSVLVLLHHVINARSNQNRVNAKSMLLCDWSVSGNFESHPLCVKSATCSCFQFKRDVGISGRVTEQSYLCILLDLVGWYFSSDLQLIVMEPRSTCCWWVAVIVRGTGAVAKKEKKIEKVVWSV